MINTRLTRNNLVYLLPLILTIALISLTVIESLTGTSSQLDIESRFRDPAYLVRQYTDIDSMYVGVYSQLGAMLWLSGASIVLFSSLVVYVMTKHLSGSLISVGIMGGLLGFDDLLLFHEWFFPTFFGVGERTLYILYMFIVLIITIKYGRTIRQYDIWLFPLAILCFALSIGVDFRQGWIEQVIGSTLRLMVEDGFKFIGIAFFWTASVKLSYKIITDHIKFKADS